MNLSAHGEPEATPGRSRTSAVAPSFRGGIPRARRWSLVWPREHGAWGILLVSFITGAAAGFSSIENLPRLLWLLLAATAAFCLRTPLENSLPASPFRARGAAERRWVNAAAAAYGLICAIAVAVLLGEGAFGLVWKPAAAAAGLFALQAVVKRWGRVGHLLGELTGASGLAIAAVAAWSVATGRFEPEALVVFLLNVLFASNQILYVQLRLREVRRPGSSSLSGVKRLFLIGEGLTAVILVAGWQASLVPGLAALAFLPILVRGGVWSFRRDQQPLRIHRVGKTELAHAILFGVLVIVGFRLPIP